tara:strand:- start:344 stop:523 length:180 start_codon:yes stop_codon:yes gene_type:complete
MKPSTVAILALLGYFLYAKRADAASTLASLGLQAPYMPPGSRGFNPVSGAPESYVAYRG